MQRPIRPFWHQLGVLEVESCDYRPDIIPSQVIEKQEDILLRQIFACTDGSNFPTSDISKILSPNVSDDVKHYIKNVLLQQQNIQPDVASAYVGKLTDDDIIEFMPHHKESFGAFKQRIEDFATSEKQKVAYQRFVNSYKKDKKTNE